jgi:diguanylate cyclase (GGDEF)-like protein
VSVALLRRGDPVLIGAATVIGALVAWYAADRGGPAAQAMVMWLYIVAASTGTAVCAGRVAGMLPRRDPARRFWRVFSIAGAVWAAGYVVQVVTALPDLPGVSPLPGPAAQAALGIGTIALVGVMLTYPLGVRSRRDRLCVFLDIATVMTAVAAISLCAALPRGSGPADLAALAGALVGPVVLMVSVFAVVKLLLGGASPFTRWTGVLGAASAGLGGTAEALGPLLLGGGRGHWWHAMEIVSTGLTFFAARVQQLVVARRDAGTAHRRRRYSVVPYLAIAATYALLVTVLASLGLHGPAWVVLAGAMCCTALVVARQVVAFADNSRLLAELDAHVETLNRSEGNLRAALGERDALAEELRRLAFYDHLTGLANRALFTDRLDLALAASRRHGGPIAVMLIDLDDFKPVNDELGHEAGDAVLRAVSTRLRDCVRETDTVARLGGDEFVVLLDRASAEGANLVAERVVAAVAEPIAVGGRRVTVGASVGVAVHHEGQDRPDLLRAADAAMYTAKRAGKGAYHLVPA